MNIGSPACDEEENYDLTLYLLIMELSDDLFSNTSTAMFSLTNSFHLLVSKFISTIKKLFLKFKYAIQVKKF